MSDRIANAFRDSHVPISIQIVNNYIIAHVTSDEFKGEPFTLADVYKFIKDVICAEPELILRPGASFLDWDGFVRVADFCAFDIAEHYQFVFKEEIAIDNIKNVKSDNGIVKDSLHKIGDVVYIVSVNSHSGKYLLGKKVVIESIHDPSIEDPSCTSEALYNFKEYSKNFEQLCNWDESSIVSTKKYKTIPGTEAWDYGWTIQYELI